MRKEPPPAAAAVSSATTTKSYEGVKHKGKVGSLTFTPTSLLFSTSSQDISWKWVAVKKHLIKSVNENKHMVKLTFMDAKDAPMILEVETRELVEQIRTDIAAARKRVAATPAAPSATHSDASNAKISSDVSSDKQPSRTNSKGSGKTTNKSAVASGSAPQSPKRLKEASPVAHHQSPKKANGQELDKKEDKKDLPLAPLSPKEAPPQSPKQAKPASKKPRKVHSDGSNHSKSFDNSSATPRSPKRANSQGTAESNRNSNSQKKALPPKVSSNNSQKRKALPPKVSSNGSQKNKELSSKPGAHSVNNSSVPATAKTLGILNDQEAQNPAPGATNKKPPPVASLPGAHSVSSYNVSPNPKTLEEEEDNLINEVIQERAALTRSQSHDARGIGQSTATRRKPMRRTQSYDPAVSSAATQPSPTRTPRRGRKRPVAGVAPPTRTSDINERLQARAAIERTRSRSPTRSRPRSRSPNRATSAAQQPGRESMANPNAVMRAIEKERQYDNETRSRSRSPARVASSAQKPSAKNRAPQKPAAQNSTTDSAASPNAVLRAIEKERQYDNQMKANQKALPDGDSSVSEKAAVDDHSSAASTNSRPQRNKDRTSGESKSQQPEQARQRRSMAAASSTGSRPSVVETRPSQASLATVSSVSSGSSHTESLPLPEPLPPLANRRSTRRPGAQAIAGIGARRGSSDLDLIDEEDSANNRHDPESPSPDILIEARLVEEGSRADLGVSVVEAKPVLEEQEMGYREILKNRKARIGICALLAFVLIVMTAIILALTLSGDGSNGKEDVAVESTGIITIGDSTDSASDIGNSIISADEPTQENLLPGVAPFLEYAFEYEGLVIPDSTRSTLMNPASPQWMAQEWLYKDPNLEEISPNRVILRFALATLYYSTTGEKWDTNYLWLDYSAHECDWFFGTPPCQIEYERFQDLYLVGNNLAGTIPPEIFVLPLSLLEVADNVKLRGTLPSEIGLANEHLNHVAIFNTQLHGSIPTQVGEMENLGNLQIFGNPNLGGTIPTEIGKLSSLHGLHIGDTSVSGTIPTELGLLPLHDIHLGLNNLSGSVPSEFGLLTGLVNLVIQHNTLISGSIPFELGTLTQLVTADFQETSLSGLFPVPLCKLARSGSLALNLEASGLYCPGGTVPDGTAPSGPVPDNGDTIGQIGIDRYFLAVFGSDIPESTNQALEDPTSPQAQARNWLLGHKDLTTFHPERVLQRFVLATWYFSAGGENWKVNDGWLDRDIHECEWATREYPLCSFPELGNVDYLEAFDNNLVGTIPPELFMLPHLQILELHANANLRGPIPSAIGFAQRLDALYLIENELEGSLPSEIGRLTRLQIVQIFDNPLMSGPLPSEMGSLYGLEILTLSNTGLTGKLPSELGSMTKLEELNISENNGITGWVPRELGRATNLKNVDFSGTSLSGSIPGVVCNNVEDLYFDNTEIHC